jgi:2-iminobutanoate/2-iminopropanoate deaminase
MGYAQAVAAAGLVFVAGQSGIDEDRRLVGPSIVEQTRRTFENLQRVLAEAGSSLDQLLSIVVFLADPDDLEDFVGIRREMLGPHLPASTLIAGVRFAEPGWLVEINAIALGPGEP